MTPGRREGVAAAGLLLAFAVLGGSVAAGAAFPVDLDRRWSADVTTWMSEHHAAVTAARILTWTGHPLVVDALVLLAAVLLWRARRPAAAIGLVAAGLVSLLVRGAVKDVVGRVRPTSEFSTATGGSFPSGHTAGAAFVAAAAVVLLARAWVLVAGVAYVVVVGASRIALEVHWPSDVVAGLLLGVAFGLLVPLCTTQLGERLLRRGGRTLPER